ncbi:hypothetical protein KIL84_014294 [Mauremys mutica]|uniref:Uncharacterized protein n=1 Tax=Mauremys mutica TaxID=74926 RepID=A0A9D3XPG2_9SAUR|nr:hypothetical protein KIL84_014294 [Mauremys mutica]
MQLPVPGACCSPPLPPLPPPHPRTPEEPKHNNLAHSVALPTPRHVQTPPESLHLAVKCSHLWGGTQQVFDGAQQCYNAPAGNSRDVDGVEGRQVEPRSPAPRPVLQSQELSPSPFSIGTQGAARRNLLCCEEQSSSSSTEQTKPTDRVRQRVASCSKGCFPRKELACQVLGPKSKGA